MTHAYWVHNGESKHRFDLPAGWTVAHHVMPDLRRPSLAVPSLVERALAAPIGSPRLADLVRRESKVALLVDDGARSTPVSQILPLLLQELLDGGARNQNIDIVVARGTHPVMPSEAVVERVGAAVYQQLRVSQHDCRAEDLVPVGRLATGDRVKINRAVAQADVTIGVGSILPHHLNGFGGGPKIIFPGVADYDAVRAHHLHYTLQPACTMGRLEANPAYADSCRIAEMARLTFLVNCVYNALAEVVEVVAGQFQAAHLEGARLSKANYGFRLEAPADVTITSAYPYREAPQTVKPIIPAALLATKPGGSVIAVAASRDRFSQSMLEAFDKVYSGQWDPQEADFFSPALVYVPACVARNAITMVSQDLDEKSVNRLGFRHAASLEEAIDHERKQRPRATVNIFPAGGLVLPLADDAAS